MIVKVGVRKPQAAQWLTPALFWDWRHRWDRCTIRPIVIVTAQVAQWGNERGEGDGQAADLRKSECERLISSGATAPLPFLASLPRPP